MYLLGEFSLSYACFKGLSRVLFHFQQKKTLSFLKAEKNLQKLEKENVETHLPNLSCSQCSQIERHYSKIPIYTEYILLTNSLLYWWYIYECIVAKIYKNNFTKHFFAHCHYNVYHTSRSPEVDTSWPIIVQVSLASLGTSFTPHN